MRKMNLLLLGVACAVLPSVVVSAENTWKVGLHSGISPFAFYNEERELTGIDVDLAMLLAEEEEYEVEFLDVPFEDLLDLVEKGEIDLAISAITITDERLERVDFTDYYHSTCARILVPQGSEIKSHEDLPGKTIGVLEASDDQTYVELIEGAKIYSFTKDNDIHQILSSGDVDAVIIDEDIAKMVEAGHEEVLLLDNKITEEKYSIAVKKGNEELLLSLNTSLATLKETGELDKIFEKYIINIETETEETNEDQ